MVTNYAKRRVKLRIERAKFQNMTKSKTKQKHDKNKKTNAYKNMTFPVFLNSFSYLLLLIKIVTIILEIKELRNYVTRI